MNSMAQPDTHPDADLLNAFVEHALSAAERAQIVSHMAGCARCREVVYLAQAAVEADPAPAARLTQPGVAPGGLSAVFARCHVAFIPAAALAAVGGVVLWVQLHPTPHSSEMAQLSSPRLEPPAAPAAPRLSYPPESQATGRKPSVAPPDHRIPGGKTQSSRRASASAPNKPSASVPSNQPAPLAGSLAEVPLPDEIHLDARSAAMARLMAPPQAAASSGLAPKAPYPPGLGSPETTARSSVVLAAPAGAVFPAPSPQQPGILPVQNGVLNAPVNGLSQVAVQSLQQADLVSQPNGQLPVLRVAKRAKLPSGLNTVSSAVLLNRLLAVDSAGSVFLSQDGGRGWEPVFAQWTGKAIEVQAPPHGLYHLMAASHDRSRETAGPDQASLNPSPSEAVKNAPAPPPSLSVRNSSPALAKKAEAAPPRPAMLFKLVTDHHEVWVSADGKTWREQ